MNETTNEVRDTQFAPAPPPGINLPMMLTLAGVALCIFMGALESTIVGGRLILRRGYRWVVGGGMRLMLMGAVMSWSLNRALRRGGSELQSLAFQHGDVAALIQQTTRQTISPEAAQFLQQALAGSLQKAFLTGLIAVGIATIIALLIPGGNAHDLIHAEHQTQPTNGHEV